MTGTRFARSGRCRFFICLGALVLMLCMVAIFHSSQQQLDETREQRLRCERQQEALNEQLQSMVEQKYNLQKTHEHERNEEMESRRNLEQKLKEMTILRTNEQMDVRVRYDKLQQTHKLLQSEHNELVAECQKSKKELMDNSNALEKKLQSVRSEAQKEKNGLNAEIVLWKEKYNALMLEKGRLELLLDTPDGKSNLQSTVYNLERTIAEYEQHCDYKPQTLNNKKPLIPPETDRNASPQPRIEKSFSEQVRVSSGLYHIDIKLTNKTQNANQSAATNKTTPSTKLDGDVGAENNVNIKAGSDIIAGGGVGAVAGGGGGGKGGGGSDASGFLLPYPMGNSNRSLILNSVENFQILPKPIGQIAENDGVMAQIRQPPANQSAVSVSDKLISPLSAPRKATPSESNKAGQLVLEANVPAKQLNSSSTPSSGLPPLPMPPNPRKLPENVAPIPANFDELLKADNANQKAANSKAVNPANVEGAEEVPKNENKDANNNRYANVVKDMEQKAHNGVDGAGAAANMGNEDSGAHEIKDEFINDPNFNLPADEDNNFFDGGAKNDAANANEKPKNDDNEDEDGLGVVDAGDIAVKNHNNLLDTNNLNNEVAGDQGKELPDGLHLEEVNEEDEDDDDYSNPIAQQQGGPAIRN